MARRRLVIALPPEVYQVLEERARDEEREPSQQAAYMLRCLLAPAQGTTEAGSPRRGELVAKEGRDNHPINPRIAGAIVDGDIPQR